MTYLSRIWINPLRTGGQLMLRNPQVLHAALLGGLSRQPVAERLLWRLESDSKHRLAVLVLTESAPSWEHIVEQAGWPGGDDAQARVRSYEPLLSRLERGREFALRLKVNPVSSTRRPVKPSLAQQKSLSAPRPRGVRVAHRTAQQQTEWFIDHIQRWGFDVTENDLGSPDLRLAARDRLVFPKKPGSRDRVTLSTATFEGRVRIAEPDLARRSMLDGVGRARAYGCGLITLAPVAMATTAAARLREGSGA
jgi:CRISPR system Cascade subunit CasE